MTLKDSELVPDFTFEDLIKAYYDCRKRKRNTLSAIKFELNLESNLIELYRDLKSGKYKIGRYICFVVLSPKPREVWAANFRDRIVHHLVYNAVKDRFHNRFIFDTYSCIPKKGTLACAKKMLHHTRAASHNYKKPVYYLKADLSNFFVSINKQILYNLVCQYVQEDWLLKLFKQIIFHNPRSNVYIRSPQELFDQLPKRKSLWNTDNTHGLPIGNLTSQFFSNVYLNQLDQYVKHNLRCKFYCRYVDDFVILDYSSAQLSKISILISDFVYNKLKITLNPKKCFINKIEKGLDFVGFFIKPHRLLLRRRTINKMFFILRLWRNSYNPFGEYYLQKIYKTINSYLGILSNAKSFNLKMNFCDIFNSLFIYPDLLLTKSFVL